MTRSLWNSSADRILLGYSIPLLALLGLSAIVYDSTTRTFALQQESSRIERQIRNVNGLVDGLNRMIGHTRAYVIFPGDQTAADAYRDARQAFTDSARTAAAIADAQTQPDVTALTQFGENYDQSLQSVFRFVDSNQLPQARATVRKTQIAAAVARRDRVVKELEAQLNSNNQ
nr:methyl-accepting chemotaxis protein [Leptolyngbya sp. Prado105]